MENEKLKNFISAILEHENLEPYQTPFRITSDSMRNWISMFDDTMKLKLNPKAKKSEGRENFLYAANAEDVYPGVQEQFRRYYSRNPNITMAQAVKKFDQSNPKGKLKFLKEKGFIAEELLKDVYEPSLSSKIEAMLKEQIKTKEK